MAQEGMKCLLCGGDLCWDNDFDASDVHDREEDERETTYKKYWHG